MGGLEDSIDEAYATIGSAKIGEMNVVRQDAMARLRFIRGAPADFYAPLTELAKRHSPLSAALDVFRDNLNSAITVGSNPYHLTYAASIHRAYNARIVAARIQLSAGQIDRDELFAEANRLGEAQFEKDMTDGELPDQIDKESLQMLATYIDSLAEFSSAAEELLRQVVVMSWGAFETLTNDLVRLLLNLGPSLAKDLSRTAPYKDVLASRSLLDALDAVGFDISQRMGDYLVREAALDSVEKIQHGLQPLLKSPSAETALKDKNLWRINKQRHLIVHRRSVVDSRYREQTGDTTPLGTKLVFDAPYVEASMCLLRDVGCTLYTAAADRWDELQS